MPVHLFPRRKHHQEPKHHPIEDFVVDLEEKTESIAKYLLQTSLKIMFWMFLPFTLPLTLTRMLISDFLEVREFCKKSLECAIVSVEILTMILEYFRDSAMSIEQKLERVSKLIRTVTGIFTLPFGMSRKIGKIIRKYLIPRKKNAMLVTLKHPQQEFSTLKPEDIYHLEISPSDCEIGDDEDSGFSSISQDDISDCISPSKSDGKGSTSVPATEDTTSTSDKTTMSNDTVPKSGDARAATNGQVDTNEDSRVNNERKTVKERSKTTKSERHHVDNERKVPSAE